MHLIAHGETKIVFRQVDVNAFCPPYFIYAAQRKLNAKDAQCFSWKWHSQQFTLFQSIHTHKRKSYLYASLFEHKPSFPAGILGDADPYQIACPSVSLTHSTD